jgi:CheY-like chemotaxis protein
MLAAALEQALALDATRTTILTARDAAQLLALPGLDRVLEACLPHAGRPWPAELTPVLERVRRLAAECAAMGSIEGFQQSDRELAALADQLQAIEWSESAEALEGRAPAVPTLSLADVLDEFPVSDSRALRVRLTAPVAAAVRAALDWLATEETPPRPLRLHAEESVLEVLCEQVNYAGLQAADKVLSAVGGNLGPAIVTGAEPYPLAAWKLRVPTFAGRASYLMLIQGDLKLALPWHSVLRICMVPASELQSSIREAGHPVLPPFAPRVRVASEYPVALVAHGLKRAYLIADRLVWRLRAQSSEVERAAPDPVLSHAVETDESEVFWVVEPGRLLERIETPAFDEPRTTESPRKETLPELGPGGVEPLPQAPAVGASGASPPAPFPAGTVAPASYVPPPAECVVPLAPASSVLPPAEPVAPVEPVAPAECVVPLAPASSVLPPAEPVAPVAPASYVPPPAECVVPLAPASSVLPPAEPVAPVEPVAPAECVVPLAPASSVLPPAEPVAFARPGTPAARAEPVRGSESASPVQSPVAAVPERRALVAEDSITARVFLARLLEQQGFSVRAVASAAELFEALEGDRWSLLCVDIELPDRAQASVLRGLMEVLRERRSGAALVALVRDATDIAVARAAGIQSTLRKPFDRDSLERLLAGLGLGARRG